MSSPLLIQAQCERRRDGRLSRAISGPDYPSRNLARSTARLDTNRVQQERSQSVGSPVPQYARGRDALLCVVIPPRDAAHTGTLLSSKRKTECRMLGIRDRVGESPVL
jgi:hypothetical protein